MKNLLILIVLLCFTSCASNKKKIKRADQNLKEISRVVLDILDLKKA